MSVNAALATVLPASEQRAPARYPAFDVPAVWQDEQDEITRVEPWRARQRSVAMPSK